MQRDGIEELIERLEKATGPDPFLDALVAAVDNGWQFVRRKGKSMLVFRRKDRSEFTCRLNNGRFTSLRYTKDMGLAMSFVPQGWIVEIHRGFDDDDEYWSRVVLIDSFSVGRGRDQEDKREVMSYGSGEPTRFIIAASLKARKAQ